MTALYETLNVSPDASQEEIKKAYRKRARETHPDHKGDNEEFKKVSKAYEILCKPSTRERYDRTGETEARSTNEIDQMLASLLSQVFLEGEGDLIKKACKSLDLGRSVAHRSIEKNEKKADKLTGRLVKFKEANKDTKNKEGRDFIVSTIEFQIKCINQEIEKSNEDVDRITQMLERLNDLKYPQDRVAKEPAWTLFMELDTTRTS